MGNSASQHRQPQVELRIAHPQLNNARIATVNQQAYIKIVVPIQEKEYHSWADGLHRYVKSTSKIMLPARHNFNKAGMCGQLGTADIFYPNFPYLLSDEIYDRKGKKHMFTEQELWYLLFSLIKAKRQNEESSKVLGDIRPKTIFLNEEGSVRLPNRDSWPHEKSKLEKSLSDQKTYIAPEEMKALNESEKEFCKFQEVAEMFSIGLTLLSLGNLVDYECLYDLEKKTLNVNTLVQDLLSWSQNPSYSQVLKSLVLNLCSHDAATRLTKDQLWDLLSKHEENIAKKTNFLIDNAPVNLHLAVQQLRTFIKQSPLINTLLQQRELALQTYYSSKTT